MDKSKSKNGASVSTVVALFNWLSERDNVEYLS